MRHLHARHASTRLPCRRSVGPLGPRFGGLARRRRPLNPRPHGGDAILQLLRHLHESSVVGPRNVLGRLNALCSVSGRGGEVGSPRPSTSAASPPTPRPPAGACLPRCAGGRARSPPFAAAPSSSAARRGLPDVGAASAARRRVCMERQCRARGKPRHRCAPARATQSRPPPTDLLVHSDVHHVGRRRLYDARHVSQHHAVILHDLHHSPTRVRHGKLQKRAVGQSCQRALHVCSNSCQRLSALPCPRCRPTGSGRRGHRVGRSASSKTSALLAKGGRSVAAAVTSGEGAGTGRPGESFTLSIIPASSAARGSRAGDEA